MYEPVHVKLFPGANGCASAGHTTAASPNESAKSPARLLSIRIPDIGRFPELVTTNENTTKSPTRTSMGEGDALMVTDNPGNQPCTATATSVSFDCTRTALPPDTPDALAVPKIPRLPISDCVTTYSSAVHVTPPPGPNTSPPPEHTIFVKAGPAGAANEKLTRTSDKATSPEFTTTNEKLTRSPARDTNVGDTLATNDNPGGAGGGGGREGEREREKECLPQPLPE